MNYQEYLQQREFLRIMFQMRMISMLQWVDCQAQLRRAYARAAARRQERALELQHMSSVATI